MTPRRKMPRLIVALIASMTAMAANAQAPGVRPQIVVGIVIDGLDYQYVDLLRGQFGNGGFNRLLSEGVVLANVDYGTNVDVTAATAMLVTGAAPSATAITGAMTYNRETMRADWSLLDPEMRGTYTTQTLSPRPLVVGTLSDEVRIAGSGIARVYGVAADAQQAVLLAGHSANCALWINPENGNWSSSSYYTDVPSFVGKRNRSESLNLRLDTVQWTPLKSPEAYSCLPAHVTQYPFRYIFARGAQDRWVKFMSSPIVNAEVTDMAGRLVTEQKLGHSGSLDMISVAYTLQPYDYTVRDDNRYELIDAYLRLDNNLEQLISTVENCVGGGHALFFVAATPPAGRSRRDDPAWGIPYGEFSTNKAKSLLNMYLMATYGNGDWIDSYHNGQFYLNHKLIESLSLDPTDVRVKAAQFLTRMSGVDRVYTCDEILQARGTEYVAMLRRNSHPTSLGDLLVEVSPGWEVVDDIISPASESRIHYVRRIATATAPVIILAPGVDSRVIDTPIDVRAITPTVARLLRIRSPNGAAMPPMVF